MSVDCFSFAVWATVQTGETTKHVLKHLRTALAALGIPHTLKTDNGLGYTGHNFATFCNLWGIVPITGTPHSPTGQAIMECTHHTLKQLLHKQEGGELSLSPQACLEKAVYVMNYLHIPGDNLVPPAVKHGAGLKGDLNETPRDSEKVWVKNGATGQWEGPMPLLTCRRGYARVSTDTGSHWAPAK